MRRAAGVLEHLDTAVPAADLAASLADIERLNAWFGGHRLTVREVARHVAEVPRDRRVVVVDVGGGGGDLALRLVRWGRRAGRAIRVVVVDRDPVTAALARRHTAGEPGIAVVQGEATALPVREDGVDVVVSVLTLHHLEPDAATAALAEMRAAARTAVVVNDLVRARRAWLLVWLGTRLLARHPISRHDGPLSVRRAYTVDELEVLAEKARLGRFEVRHFPWLARLLLVVS
jgi:2-polyprenyl-3-methyl-5-hydroxy-6-metoxy-1,4-benzoquinol methylase